VKSILIASESQLCQRCHDAGPPSKPHRRNWSAASTRFQLAPPIRASFVLHLTHLSQVFSRTPNELSGSQACWASVSSRALTCAQECRSWRRDVIASSSRERPWRCICWWQLRQSSFSAMLRKLPRRLRPWPGRVCGLGRL